MIENAISRDIFLRILIKNGSLSKDFRAFLAYFLEKICIFAPSIPTLCQPRRMTNLVKGGGHLADVRLYGKDTT